MSQWLRSFDNKMVQGREMPLSLLCCALFHMLGLNHVTGSRCNQVEIV